MILLIAAGFHKWDIPANSDSRGGAGNNARGHASHGSCEAHHRQLARITSSPRRRSTSPRHRGKSFSIRKGFRSRQHHGADRRQIADGITSRQRRATMRALRFYRSQRLHFGSRSPFQSSVKQGTGLLEPFDRGADIPYRSRCRARPLGLLQRASCVSNCAPGWWPSRTQPAVSSPDQGQTA